mgnify:FL=1|tara:strand:- start:328 stop:744 length:417 start_codon:yes stop_codon:yes gene_type:complete
MGTGKPGRKVKGGGKSRTNKDHRHLCHTINKSRWDDICSEQLKPENIGKVVAEKTELDPDKPGLGQHYCVSCARYYISDVALKEHQKTVKHKRRLKELTTKPAYSHNEANAGAGRGAADNGLSSGTRPVASSSGMDMQ